MPDIKNIAVQSGMTYGAIQNNWDALKDDFDAVAYLPFGDEYWDAMNQIMNGIGNREIAKQPSVKWFEMNRMEVPMTSSAAVGTTPATQFNITLPSSEIETLGTVSYTWPALNEIWRHAKSGQLFQITTKATATPQTIGLTALTAAGVGISIAAGDKFFYVGVSVGENSTSQASKYVFDTLHTAKLQTFRHDANSSSEALYNQLWYSQLENGVQTPYSNSRDIIYLQREHQVAIVNTFLAGEETTNTNINSRNSFQTTNGLIPSIFAAATEGQAVDVGPAITNLDVSDFYELEAALTKQDASVKNYMVWTTAATSQYIEKALGGGSTTTNYFANQNVQINKVEMNKTFWGEGAYADLMDRTYSFNNVVFNGKNFGLVRMGVFDNPQTFGTTDSNWSNYAVFLPMTSRGIDDGLGNMGKYIRLAHKPGAFMNMWQTGGRAAANKNDEWSLGVHIVSEIGFKFINANKYGIFYVS
jgi:hypothetical protein